MIDKSVVRGTARVSLLLLAALMPQALRAAPDGANPPPPPAVQRQIQAILQEQASRTPTQQKIDSNLLYESRRQGGQPMAAGINTRTFRTGVTVRAGGMVEVDIDAVEHFRHSRRGRDCFGQTHVWQILRVQALRLDRCDLRGIPVPEPDGMAFGSQQISQALPQLPVPKIATVC